MRSEGGQGDLAGIRRASQPFSFSAAAPVAFDAFRGRFLRVRGAPGTPHTRAPAVAGRERSGERAQRGQIA